MAEVDSEEAPDTADAKAPPSRAQHIWRWFRSGVKTLSGLVAVYFLIVLVGLIPVNNDFKQSKLDDDGSVRIFVQSSDVHADILVPLTNEHVNWLDYFPLKKTASPKDYIAFGWGERAFYLETPTWGDLTISTAVGAMLLPTESIMHCTIERPIESKSCRSVVISDKQYRKLIGYITRSFKPKSESEASDASLLMTPPSEIERRFIHEAWSKKHHFYQAMGSYHAMNTCNCWVGNGLSHAGVRIARFTPMPKTVFLYWKETDE